MFRRFLTPSSALAGVAAITSYYGFRIASSTALPPGLSIASSHKVSDSFAHSLAVSAVNPHRHITIEDTRSVDISVPNDISHEQILAKFLSGVFGGYVFAPERMALRLVGKQLVNFKELDSTPVSTQIWKASEIRQPRLPFLHSVLFGSFRIVGIRLETSAEQPLHSTKPEPSYVDIAFGADDNFIAGVHRFSVLEIESPASVEGKRSVTITFDHTSCNPREDKPLGPDAFQTFHLWYSMLLFKEGVANVIRTS